MIVMSEVRCSDCLTEFNGGPRFAVLKEDRSHVYSDEERKLTAHLYHVWVCAECSQWYDDAIEAGGSA